MPSRRNQSLKALQLELERQQTNLNKHEILWRERWDAISSPFLKVQDLNSRTFRAQREAVLGPWRSARAALASARNKTI